MTFVHPTAEIAAGAVIGSGTRIWRQVHIREQVEIGEECIVGSGVYVDVGVHVGNRCKLENGVFIFSGFNVTTSGIRYGAVGLTHAWRGAVSRLKKGDCRAHQAIPRVVALNNIQPAFEWNAPSAISSETNAPISIRTKIRSTFPSHANNTPNKTSTKALGKRKRSRNTTR